MVRKWQAVIGCCILTGCASTPNSHWFESGMMNFEVLEVGPKQYKLTGQGAGNHSAEQVRRAFELRAAKLCGSGKPNYLMPQPESYQYRSSGGGFSFVHNAFKLTSTVSCE